MAKRHTRINTILLDMDGVLFDFVKGFCNKYGFDVPKSLPSWNIEEELGISRSEFYKKLNEMGYVDWFNLKPIAYGFKLYTYLKTLDKKIYFCSSPSLNPESWSAKRAKLQEYFPENARNTILIHDKWMLANESTLLIDDSQRNVDLFRQHGGNAIAFPQSHNENPNVIDKAYFIQRLMEENKWNI